MEPIISRHGGYRKLKSFQLARLCYDVTVRFCERYVPSGSRTRDQMVQAARSGVQNIAEGSAASGTSKKTELKLTSVARASLEELRLDYEDFPRQRDLPHWPAADPRRASLVARRCGSAREVADWVRGVRDDALRAERHGACSNAAAPGYPEIAANAALTLIGVTCALRTANLPPWPRPSRKKAVLRSAFTACVLSRKEKGKWTEWTLWTTWTLAGMRPAKAFVHVVHNVHLVHYPLPTHKRKRA